MLLAVTSPGHAQRWGRATDYVNITRSRVERLSNAVRIFLEADGVLETQVDGSQFWVREAGTSWWKLRDLKVFRINLLNARSQIGRYVAVEVFPASHVTLSVPTEAREGVGLEVALSLYAPARAGKIQMGDDVADWYWSWDLSQRVDMLLSENQRQLILTVHTDRHYDVTEDQAKTPEPERVELSVERSDSGLRLRALNAKLEAVADAVGQAADLRIVLSPGLTRRVTANLPTMPPARLLQTLCRVACLNLAEHDGSFYIGEGTVGDVSSYWAGQVRQVQLKYLPVDQALLLLPAFILSHLQVNIEGNTVVIYGPPALLDKVEADLRILDAPPQQLRLRAMTVHVVRHERADRVLSALVNSGTTTVDYAPAAGRLRVGLSDVPLEKIAARLRSLHMRGDVRIEAYPETSVVSGSLSRLFIGQQQYYRFLRRRRYGQELVLRKVDVGVQLEASPWSGDGETIMVPFRISADNIISRDAQGLPLISRQTARGNLRLKSGQTIVFGGLLLGEGSQQTDASRALEPVHGIPGLGPLLQAGTRSARADEVVVFLAADSASAQTGGPSPSVLSRGPG